MILTNSSYQFFQDSINDSLMSDGNHLNINGAKFYSKLIFKKL